MARLLFYNRATTAEARIVTVLINNIAFAVLPAIISQAVVKIYKPQAFDLRAHCADVRRPLVDDRLDFFFPAFQLVFGNDRLLQLARQTRGGRVGFFGYALRLRQSRARLGQGPDSGIHGVQWSHRPGEIN